MAANAMITPSEVETPITPVETSKVGTSMTATVIPVDETPSEVETPPKVEALPQVEAAPKVETPFTTAANGTDVAFWQSYIAARPSPTEDFFDLINTYHAAHGDGAQRLAHDVGTGPGNIALRLAPYYPRVVGSDVNAAALAAAEALRPGAYAGKVTFLQSPAEALASGVVPAEVGIGQTDLLTVSECMPLLDAPKALQAFHALLRPAGTLAIYFYGRPVFADGANAAACDALYERAATRVCQFMLPFKGSPGFPFHQRGAEGLVSYLDNIALPAADWTAVERRKWNCDHPLLFNGKDGFDFAFEPVDRRAAGEQTTEVVDRGFWAEEWDVARFQAYLDSVFPNHRVRAGDKYAEVEAILDELRTAMGSAKRTVTFSVVLILATKK